MNKETKELIKQIVKLIFKVIELVIMLIGFGVLQYYLITGKL